MTNITASTAHFNPITIHGSQTGEIAKNTAESIAETVSIKRFNAKGDTVLLRGVASSTAGSHTITLSSAAGLSATYNGGTNYSGYVGKLAAMRGAGSSQDGLAVIRFYSGKIATIASNGLTLTITDNDTDGGLNVSSGTGAILTAAGQDIFIGTNDTQAFRDGCAYMRTLGKGSLYFPAGIYIVTDVSQIYSNIEIYGDGDATHLQMVRNSTPVTDNNFLGVFWWGCFGPAMFGKCLIPNGTEATVVPTWVTRCAVGQSTAAVGANAVTLTLATAVTKSITAYGSGGIRTGSLHYPMLTSTAHGYGEDEHVLIAGMGAPYDGWWRIINVTANTFDLRWMADANGDPVAHDYDSGYSLPGGATASNRVAASQFSVGDMVVIQSLDYQNQSQGSNYYIKIPNYATFTRIISITGQVIVFDQAVGWSSGTNTVLMMKPLAFKDTTNTYLLQNIATNNSVHHLKIGCLQPFGMGGFIRSTAHDLTLDMCDSFLSINACCNSTISNIRGSFARLCIEVKYISHDTTVSHFNLTAANATFGDGRGLFSLGESARGIRFDTFNIQATDHFRATGPAEGYTPQPGQIFQIQRGEDCVIKNGTMHLENTNCTNITYYRAYVTAAQKFVSDPLCLPLPPTRVVFENLTTYQGANTTLVSMGNAGSSGSPTDPVLRNCHLYTTSASGTAVLAANTIRGLIIGNTFGYTLGSSPVGDISIASTCTGMEVRGNRISGFCANAGVGSIISGNVCPLSTSSATPWPSLGAERIRDAGRGPNTVTLNKSGLMLCGVYNQMSGEMVYPAGGAVYDHWLLADGTIGVIVGKAIRNQTWTLVAGEYRNDTEVPSGKPLAVFRDDRTIMQEGTVTALLKGQWGWDGTKIYLRLREDVAPATVTALPATGDNSAGLRYIPAGTTYLPPHCLPAATVWSGPSIRQAGQVVPWDGTTAPAGLTLEVGAQLASFVDGTLKTVGTAGTTGTAATITATTASGSKNVTAVSSLVGLQVGQVIAIAGALTSARITAIGATNTLSVDTNASALVTAAALTYVAPVFANTDVLISAPATAVNYTPTAPTVRGHLAGIDTALGTVITAPADANYFLQRNSANTGWETQREFFTIPIDITATVRIYKLNAYVDRPGTITGAIFWTSTAGMTATVAVRVGVTAVTGLGAISATSTKPGSLTAATALNTFVVGNELNLNVSAVASSPVLFGAIVGYYNRA